MLQGRGSPARLFPQQGMHSYMADFCTLPLPSEFHASAAVRMATRAPGGYELPFFSSQRSEPSQGAASLRGPSPSKACIATRRLSVRGLFFRNSVLCACYIIILIPHVIKHIVVILYLFVDCFICSKGAASLRGSSPQQGMHRYKPDFCTRPLSSEFHAGAAVRWPPAPRGRVSP